MYPYYTTFTGIQGIVDFPRIYVQVREEGILCSRNRLVRLMQKHRIAARPLRRCVVTTHSKPELPVADNRLNRQFTADAPNRKWTADISYVWTGEGRLYLGVVLDLFSRRVVGWAMSQT